jgi:membrane protease YdiL (CAAX protease family)
MIRFKRAPDATTPIAADAARDAHRPVGSVLHTVGLLCLLFAWAYFGSVLASHMRAEITPNRLQLYLITLAAEWLFFAYVVWGAQGQGVTLRELVGPRWSVKGKNFLDIAIAGGFWVVSLGVVLMVGRLLRLGPGRELVGFMLPRTPLEIVLWVVLSITTGICEETIFRGYLQRQFIGWTHSTLVGVVVSGAIFGAVHIYGGGKRAIVIAVYGMLFGILAAWRRSLKPGMIAHAWQDIASGIPGSLLSK